jgi:hypothetical protein
VANVPNALKTHTGQAKDVVVQTVASKVFHGIHQNEVVTYRIQDV